MDVTSITEITFQASCESCIRSPERRRLLDWTLGEGTPQSKHALVHGDLVHGEALIKADAVHDAEGTAHLVEAHDNLEFGLQASLVRPAPKAPAPDRGVGASEYRKRAGGDESHHGGTAGRRAGDALPLGAAAFTRLVKVAVAQVEDYYLDEGNGWEDDDEHGYEVVAQFVDEWARQSGFLERDDLEEIIETLASLPEWLKKLLARKSLGWFEEIAKSGKADAARRLDVVMQICSALRREHVWAGWEERQQGEPIQ